MVPFPEPDRILFRQIRLFAFQLELLPCHILMLFTVYEKYGSTGIGSVALWDSTPMLWLSDAQAINSVASESSIFQKDVEAVSFGYRDFSLR